MSRVTAPKSRKATAPGPEENRDPGQRELSRIIQW